jgi:hypothetical protein
MPMLQRSTEPPRADRVPYKPPKSLYHPVLKLRYKDAALISITT